jgi:hypothetical protein
VAAELKAEAREVLRQHGVDNFVLKPVRRSYAFELAEIPRGEQWVLKVRYPASKPALPLGLSGAPPSLSSPSALRGMLHTELRHQAQPA